MQTNLRLLGVLGFTVALSTLVACASGEDTIEQGASATQPPRKGDDDACVTKESKANDKGIGAYCDKEVRCGKGFVCSGDFGAPEGASFCTKPCNADSDCGSGAHCFAEERGKGCVLDVCQAK